MTIYPSSLATLCSLRDVFVWCLLFAVSESTSVAEPLLLNILVFQAFDAYTSISDIVGRVSTMEEKKKKSNTYVLHKDLNVNMIVIDNPAICHARVHLLRLAGIASHLSIPILHFFTAYWHIAGSTKHDKKTLTWVLQARREVGRPRRKQKSMSRHSFACVLVHCRALHVPGVCSSPRQISSTNKPFPCSSQSRTWCDPTCLLVIII